MGKSCQLDAGWRYRGRDGDGKIIYFLRAEVRSAYCVSVQDGVNSGKKCICITLQSRNEIG